MRGAIMRRPLHRPPVMAPGPIMADYTGIFGPKKPVTVATTQGAGGGGATRNGGRRQWRHSALGWLLVMALVPAPAAASCQCGLLVMREAASGRRWTLGETVMEGGVRPADCRRETAEMECLNTCANTTVVLTGNMDFHMLPLRLSIETQRHICETLQPRKQRHPEVTSVTELVSRSLPVGGFYRHCSQDWKHSGVVFPDRICCLQDKVVDCNEIKKPEKLPFLTVFRKRRQVNNTSNSKSADDRTNIKPKTKSGKSEGRPSAV